MKYLIYAFACILSFSELWASENPLHIHYQVKTTPESAAILKNLGEAFKSETEEVNFTCPTSGNSESCLLDIKPDPKANMSVELIPAPFSNEPYILRLHGGTQATQGSLYKALGNFTPTKDFKGILDERKFVFDNQNFNFRCVATRSENPQYTCWILILTRVLSL
jgi:hypothetical protein